MTTHLFSAQRGTINIIVLIIVAAIFAGLGLWLGGAYFSSKPLELKSAVLYPQPKEINDFQLVGDDNNPYTKERWNDRWSLLFFGFTYCPDVCPLTLNQLKQVYTLLDDQQADVPAVALISVDPDRDSPEQLARYVGYFDARFEGATGEAAELSRLARELSIAYAVEPHEDGATDYNVDHSTALLLVNPQAQIHAIFSAPHDPAVIAGDLIQIMGN